MPDELIIRTVEPDDVEPAAALGAEIIRLHHAENPNRFFLPEHVEQGYAWWLRRELASPGAVALVAERDDDIVGYACGAIEERDWSVLLDRHGTVHDVFVVQTARRQGVGRALLEALIRRLEALGAPRIVLSTMVSNEPAQRLFAALGFRPTMLEMTREQG